MKNYTQLKKVERHLIKHGKINVFEAWYLYNITRLSALIYILRNEGYEIKSERVAGDGNSFVNYVFMGRKL